MCKWNIHDWKKTGTNAYNTYRHCKRCPKHQRQLWGLGIEGERIDIDDSQSEQAKKFCLKCGTGLYLGVCPKCESITPVSVASTDAPRKEAK